mmetsp:Transcript_21270/g.60189  ORF Transcript_21270/g.60189 Transcript_21270/m.60189 type:complete len:243 (-) Transcript_21270:2167-2895(-)
MEPKGAPNDEGKPPLIESCAPTAMGDPLPLAPLTVFVACIASSSSSARCGRRIRVRVAALVPVLAEAARPILADGGALLPGFPALVAAVVEHVLWVDRRLVEEDELPECADCLLAVSEDAVKVPRRRLCRVVPGSLHHEGLPDHRAANEHGEEPLVGSVGVVLRVLVRLGRALSQIDARAEHGASRQAGRIDLEGRTQDRQRTRWVGAVDKHGLVRRVAAVRVRATPSQAWGNLHCLGHHKV